MSLKDIRERSVQVSGWWPSGTVIDEALEAGSQANKDRAELLALVEEQAKWIREVMWLCQKASGNTENFEYQQRLLAFAAGEAQTLLAKLED